MDYNMDMSNMDMSNMDMSTPAPTLTAGQSATLGAALIAYQLFLATVLVLYVVGLWRVFIKAGQKGWAALIPFYNLYILLKIIGRPGWWILLFFIPLVGIVVNIVVALELGRSFGRSKLFSIIMLVFLSPIGFIILGFGGSKYAGAAGQPVAAPVVPDSAPPAAPPTDAAPAV